MKGDETINANILIEIADCDKDIKSLSATFKNANERRDNIIWQAQQKNITHAGNYELVSKVKITRTIDMAALWSWAPKDLVMKISTLAL